MVVNSTIGSYGLSSFIFITMKQLPMMLSVL